MSDYKYPNPPNHTPFDREAYAALRAAYRAHYDACCYGSAGKWPYNDEAVQAWMAAVDRADIASREKPGLMYGEALERERRAIRLVPRTVWVYAEGFHGAYRIPIRGVWQRIQKNYEVIQAVDYAVILMDRAAVTEMYKLGGCTTHGCECGEYFGASPVFGSPNPGEGLFEIAAERLPEGLRAELLQAAPAAS